MKVLLDTCVWGKAADEMRAAGHDVIWSGDWPEDPGDEEILSRAWTDQRVLVTLDKDFGELAVLQGAAHSGIVRLVGFRAQEQGRACLSILNAHADELARGAIITGEPGRVRIRPPNRINEDETE